MMRDGEKYLAPFNKIHSCLLFLFPVLLLCLLGPAAGRLGKLGLENAEPKEGRNHVLVLQSDIKEGAHAVSADASYPLPSRSPGFPSREGEGSIRPRTGIVEASSHYSQAELSLFFGGVTVFSSGVDVLGTFGHGSSFSAFRRILARKLHIAL